MPKVAAIQMCSSHDVDHNLEVAGMLIHKAAALEAKLAVLPENFALMAKGPAERFAQQEKIGQGKIQNALARYARENKIWLVGGTIPMATDVADKIRAACLVYNDQGQLVGRYDKIHMFDAVVSADEAHQESAIIEPGNQCVVLETPVGKLGLAICFDVRFPFLFTQLAGQGAELIALPSAFTVPTGQAHWEILTRCRALDSFTYIVAAAQGGTHSNGRQTYGHSLIVDPWGRIIAEKRDNLSGVIISVIDLAYVYHCRESIPLRSNLKKA